MRPPPAATAGAEGRFPLSGGLFVLGVEHRDLGRQERVDAVEAGQTVASCLAGFGAYAEYACVPEAELVPVFRFSSLKRLENTASVDRNNSPSGI